MLSFSYSSSYSCSNFALCSSICACELIALTSWIMIITFRQLKRAYFSFVSVVKSTLSISSTSSIVYWSCGCTFFSFFRQQSLDSFDSKSVSLRFTRLSGPYKFAYSSSEISYQVTFSSSTSPLAVYTRLFYFFKVAHRANFCFVISSLPTKLSFIACFWSDIFCSAWSNSTDIAGFRLAFFFPFNFSVFCRFILFYCDAAAFSLVLTEIICVWDMALGWKRLSSCLLS